MGRAPCCDKDGLKKGPWLPEEDEKLINYIQKHGPGNWRALPKKAGLQRCGKSCRLRWTNYLRPDIKRGRFSFEEEEAIIQLHSMLGNKWSAIAAKLPGRTDNEIKNYWNTHIRKRLLRNGIDPVTHTRRLDFLDLPSILGSSPLQSPPQLNLIKLLGLQSLVNPELLRLASLLSTNPNENLNFLMQNLQANHQLNQLNSLSNQIQTPNQTTPCVSVSGDAQVMEPNLHQYQQNISVSGFDAQNFAAQASALLVKNDDQWKSNVLPNLETAGQECQNTQQPASQNNYLSDHDQALMDDLFDDLAFQSNKSNQNLSFSSVFSSPCSSQQTPLSSTSANPNSCSTASAGSNEDEIDSYCQNLLNFDMPVDLFGACSS